MILSRAEKAGINLRSLGKNAVAISLDETTTENDLANDLSKSSARKIDR